MHPAPSVVAFTTFAGIGYGLLCTLGALIPFGILPARLDFGLVALAIAFVLITGGLLSSTFHLGRPERAWRSLSQWRSSWLSREGIASLATYVPAVLFGTGWIIAGPYDPWTIAAGALAAACAVITVVTTGMIYASLKPIPQWSNRYTVPGYLIYSLMSGTVLLSAICIGFGERSALVALIAVLLTVCGWLWKTVTWRANDARRLPVTLNSATGLAQGTVRSIEWPHTEENYILKEMGYRIARKHAARLRILVHLLAFAIPFAASLLVVADAGTIAVAAAIFAVPVQAIGLLIERWLFFAQATHTAALYYGR